MWRWAILWAFAASVLLGCSQGDALPSDLPSFGPLKGAAVRPDGAGGYIVMIKGTAEQVKKEIEMTLPYGYKQSGVRETRSIETQSLQEITIFDGNGWSIEVVYDSKKSDSTTEVWLRRI